jgi:hypothetical protein
LSGRAEGSGTALEVDKPKATSEREIDGLTLRFGGVGSIVRVVLEFDAGSRRSRTLAAR